MRRPWLVLVALLMGVVAVVARTTTRQAPVERERIVAGPVEKPEPAHGSSDEDASEVEDSEGVDAPAPVPRDEGETVFPKSLVWLARAQNTDGSWGSTTELVGSHGYTKTAATALALLAYFGAGYSHLSRDEIDGRKIGERIRDALVWLRDHAEGDPLSASLAALAWGEAYGLTGSNVLKESAQAAIDRAASLQATNGSWSGDLLTTLWGAQALASAKLGGLNVEESKCRVAVEFLRGEIDVHGDAAAAAGLVLLTKVKSDPSLETAARALRALPPTPSQQNHAYWFFGSLAAFQLDGPQGLTWKTWNPALKTTLLGGQDRDGSWPGAGGPTASVVRTSLGTLSLEVYYRYANVFGSR